MIATATVSVLPASAPVHVALARMHTAGTALADEAERAAAGAMGPHRAAEFLRGRSLLRRLVAKVLGPRAAAAPVHTTERGKPLLAHDTSVDVSISHTDGYVAAALWAGGEVGVDVAETTHPLNPRLVRRCCGQHADDVLARADAGAFTRVWAVQEACVKATGAGLAGIPWRIPVDPSHRRGEWDDVSWRLVDVELPCVLALAVRPDTSDTDQEEIR